MSNLQTFLDGNGVSNIPRELVDSIDDVAGPALLIALSPVPPSPVIAIPTPLSPSLGDAVVASVTGKSNASPSSAPGLSILMQNFITDVNLLIVTPMVANAVAMNALPFPLPPIPIPPIAPSALASPVSDRNALGFGKAMLEWVASIIAGDPRTAGPLSVLSAPGA